MDQATIENALDGNICRCTGYRPILDAFKSFASDASDDLKKKVADIEELGKKACAKSCSKNGLCSNPSGTCGPKNGQSLILKGGLKWEQPTTMEELNSILKALKPEQPYKLIAGNSGTGIYKDEFEPQVYIDVNRVKELKEISKTPLILGGGVSLGDALKVLAEVAKDNPKYKYGASIVSHWSKVSLHWVRC